MESLVDLITKAKKARDVARAAWVEYRCLLNPSNQRLFETMQLEDEWQAARKKALEWVREELEA